MTTKTDPQLIIDRMKIRLEELQEQMPVIAELEATLSKALTLLKDINSREPDSMGYSERDSGVSLSELLKDAQNDE